MGMMTYGVIFLFFLIGTCTAAEYYTVTSRDCKNGRLSGFDEYDISSSYSRFYPLIVKIDTKKLGPPDCSIKTMGPMDRRRIHYQFRKYFYPDEGVCKVDVSISDSSSSSGITSCGLKKSLVSEFVRSDTGYIRITFPVNFKSAYPYGNVQAEIKIYTDSVFTRSSTTSAYVDRDLDSWDSTVYHIPIIIGGVIGGLFALATIITIIVAVVCMRRTPRTPGQVASTNQQGMHAMHYTHQPGQGVSVNAPCPLAPGMQPSEPNPHYPHYPQEYNPADPAYAPITDTEYNPAMSPPAYENSVL